ncbi:MAG TPA: nickel-dependent lactate racemase [Syntrophomonadaceae bacterium]|nr:nickel-dependent lactate racemase [Syntrophomonadaceae bacterium]
MKYQLAYGRQFIDLDIPDEYMTDEILPQENECSDDTDETAIILDALQNPIGTPTLKDLAEQKKARNAVIIVNDITRPTPYQVILPPLLQELEQVVDRCNIKLIIATGIHRPHTTADNLEIFGEYICKHYSITNHNCDENLASLGRLSNGFELVINRDVAEADLVITTGLVSLHYFAGFSGGRKSILPGIAGRELIKKNHQMMNDARACLGNYKDNPVSKIMIEAARKAKVDFILNVVTDSQHKVRFCTTGDLYEAWLKAVHFCEKMNVVSIEAPADIVIAGCGGFPKDINMYQSQKAIDSAVLAVKKGGTIILAAECSEGLGEDTFARWINEASSKEDIKVRFSANFELGGHKAFAICRELEHADIIMVSSLPDEIVAKMFITPAPDLNTALKIALGRQGTPARILLMPEASRLAVKIAPCE